MLGIVVAPIEAVFGLFISCIYIVRGRLRMRPVWKPILFFPCMNRVWVFYLVHLRTSQVMPVQNFGNHRSRYGVWLPNAGPQRLPQAAILVKLSTPHGRLACPQSECVRSSLAH